MAARVTVDCMACLVALAGPYADSSLPRGTHKGADGVTHATLCVVAVWVICKLKPREPIRGPR